MIATIELFYYSGLFLYPLILYPPQVFWYFQGVKKETIDMNLEAATRVVLWKKAQACNFIKEETLAQVFSCEFFGNF